MYHKTVLDNGLKVITEEIPHFKSASIGIWVNAGSRDETEKNNGISHFIEHMIFKGTKTRTATEIAELMDGVGGQLNAFTEKEHTCFYARVIDRHTDMAMELLFDMLNNSVFEPVELERERSVILDEIRLYDDSPDDIVFDMFNKLIWDSHPLGRPIAGTKEIIESITREDIFGYIKSRYLGGNIIISATGNIKHDEIVAMCNRYSKGLTASPPELRKAETFVPYQKRSISRKKDCEQTYVIIGKEGISARDEAKYCLSITDSILGSSMSSRIFQEIREKRGLAYSVGSFAHTLSDTGVFGIFAGTSPSTLDEVVNLSIEITENMRKNGALPEEISRAKEQLKGSLSLALESTSGRMLRLAKSEFYHGRLIPPEEIFEKIDKVTTEDISALCEKLLNTSDYSKAVLGQI